MDLENYLKENGIWHRFIARETTIHTKDAAVSAGVDLSRLTKSLVFLDDDKNPVMVIVPGNRKVSFKKAAEAAGSKKLYLVPFDKAEEYSGYAPGATPPVHHKMKMKVILDEGLMKHD